MNAFACRSLVLALLLAAFAASPATAFDGRRDGFILGFGAGPGNVFEAGDASDDVTGVFTDFKIGAGIGDRTVLHYSGKQLWGKDRGNPFFDMFPLVALTRYTRADGPSTFWSVGAGVCIFVESLGSEVAGGGGPAAYVGGGYEFARHWSFEVGLNRTFLEERRDLYGVTATLNALAY